MLVFLASGCSLAAATGMVQTRTGERFSGTIRLSAGRLVVADPRSTTLVTVKEANLDRVLFDLPPPEPDREEASQGEAAAGWERSGPGEAVCQAGAWRLSWSGPRLESGREDLQFVHKTVRGKSELVARVVAVRSNGGGAVAGLMMRESLEPGSKHVFLGLQSGRGGRWEWRRQTGGAVEQRPEEVLVAPCWLRLKREANTVTAYRSRNGRRWRLIDRLELPMAEELHVGLALAGSAATPAGAGVIPRDVALIDRVREGPAGMTGWGAPRVRLRSGSVIVGPVGTDGTALRFPGAVVRPAVRLADVAAVEFQWLPYSLRRRVASGFPGVLLAQGEFLEGELTRIGDGRVTISSVLFGLRSYEVEGEVMAVVLHPSALARAA